MKKPYSCNYCDWRNHGAYYSQTDGLCALYMHMDGSHIDKVEEWKKASGYR